MVTIGRERRKPYTRKLSPTERLWIIADILSPPFVNQFVLEGRGDLDETAWRDAVEKACRVHPGSRLALCGVSLFSRWKELPEPAPVTMVDGAGWDGFGPEGAPFLVRPLPWKSGPVCEVLLVSGNPNRVIFRTHHAVMDGRGTQLWAGDIFRALRDEPLIGSDSTDTDGDLATRLPANGNPPRDFFPRDAVFPTGIPRRQKEGTTWKRIRVEGPVSSLLPRVARHTAREAFRHRHGIVRLAFPVDMRPSVREDIRSTANLTGIAHVEIGRESTIATIGKDLADALAGWQVHLPFAMPVVSLLPLSVLVLVGRMGMEKMRVKGFSDFSGILSNLGILPIKLYHGGGFIGENGFFIPPGSDGTPFFMALSGSGTWIDLVATIPQSLASDGRMEAFMDGLARELS